MRRADGLCGLLLREGTGTAPGTERHASLLQQAANTADAVSGLGTDFPHTPALLISPEQLGPDLVALISGEPLPSTQRRGLRHEADLAG